tara:strand:- start:34305 stop:35444 length:1140 start_codon:yes stop_codon:yes gene_type:complete
MSHLLHEYAKSLGVKVSKPDLQQHFFPCLDKKYILFYNRERQASKIYKHYSTIFQLLRETLDDHGIKIYQIGGENAIAGVNRHLSCSLKNEAYIVAKSMLYLGPDSHLSQYASSQDVKTITLHGNNYASSTKPFWGSFKNKACLEPDWNSNPCFSAEDPQRQIDSIKPEEVCKKILEFCGLGHLKFNFKTINIGDSYDQKIVEVVPTAITKGLPKSFFIRIDYGVEEEALLYYCANHEVILVTDQLPQISMLMQFRENVKRILYIVQDKNDTIPEEYFEYLKKLGIDFILLSDKEDELPFLRNKYFETQVHPQYDQKEPIACSDNAKFLTNKKIIEGDKVYMSYAHYKKGLDSCDKVLDTPEYWEESKHFYIYEQEKSS